MKKISLSQNKKTKLTILVLIGIDIISVFFACTYAVTFVNPAIETVHYKCADNKQISVVYKKYSAYFDMDTHGTIHARQILPGVKYKSGDVILWRSGGDMMIEDRDNVPYYGCSLNGPPPDDIQVQSK